MLKRAVHTESTSKPALQVFLVPHGSAQGIYCTYYSQNIDSQRIYAQPWVHLSHVCVPLSSNPGVGKAYPQCTATISQLALQELRGQEKLLLQEVRVFDKNWSSLGGSELGSGICPFKRNAVSLQPSGLYWSCQAIPPEETYPCVANSCRTFGSPCA